MNLKRFPN